MQNIKINIKGTNLDLTDNIHNHVDEKIASITKFLRLDNNQEAIFDVEVGKTTTAQHHGKIMRAEINLEYSGKFYRSENVSENLFDAIDRATEEIIREIKKKKERRFDLIRKGATKFKNLFRRG